jgi:hypothetical protein
VLISFTDKNIRDPTPPTVTRAALEAFEHQSGLPDVARFLIETRRVSVVALSDAGNVRDHGSAVHS